MTQGPDRGPSDVYSRAVGEHGIELLDYLCVARQNAEPFSEQREEWQPGDSWGLQSWLALEDGLLLAPLSAGLRNETQLRRFHDASDMFHQHLPYNEPERAWLMKMALSPFTISNIPEYFYNAEEESITVAGLLRVASGRDLMRRWLSWRAETDEYTGQAVMDCVQDSLRDLVELVAPDQRLPASYRELRHTE
jgi:hypothetical protein